MNPIDIIANAMRHADGGHTMGTGALAEVAANALDDWRIITVAADALRRSGWEDFEGVRAEDIARTVLCSVGGAR